MAKKKITKKQRNIIVAIVLLVAVIGGVCFTVFNSDEKIQVETLKAQKQTISETLDTTGTVSAASQSNFVIPSGVKIVSLNVKEGDIVEAGDVIATFDINSLNEALLEKESAYEKAQAAYKNAKTTAEQSKSKVAEVKKQISELESEIARLEQKSTQPVNANSDKKTDGVKVSDSLVKRFVSLAKLFGVEYSTDEAKKVLTNMLSAGSSVSDISSLMDNLSAIAGASGSFDMSSLMGMSGSSELMSAEMSLIQLKAQLATLELQSDSTYISAFKKIADSTRESYVAAQAQVDGMKNGWIAEAKGIVSEVNLTEDGAQASAQTSELDISSILSAVTSGGDITSLLTSFLDDGQVAVKILYYPLVADISLSKYDVLDVELNQDVIIVSASGIKLEGKVSYVSAVATSSSGLSINSLMGGSTTTSSVIPAQVTIENADSSVIVGVDVPVSIITDTVENAVVVPVETICIDGDDVFVYVLVDGKAVKKNVELGISSDTHYQILSGITLEDELIKSTSGLGDGVKVQTK